MEAWQPEALEAPPLREMTAPAPVAYASGSSEPVAPRRRAVWIIAGMLLLLGIVAGVGYWRIRSGVESNEIERFQRAEEKYKEEDFVDASAAFQSLHRDFPDSPQQKKYRFLAELSDVRKAVYARESPDETAKALQRLVQLTEVYQGDSLLKEREADLRRTLEFLANELTKLAESEKAPALLPLAKRAWGEAKKYPDVSSAERERELDAKWKRVEQILAAHFERQRVIAVIKKTSERATAATVESARVFAEKTKLHDDPEVRALLDEMFKAHREQVKFVPVDSQATRSLEEDQLESISVTPSLQAERTVNVKGPPVLSLARGVLYALEPTNGELRWARRVGIDTHVLPLRVPADAITPELVLVFSSDQRSLSAVVRATGETLWQTPLSDACLGTPVLVDRVVLAPTATGRIDEIEIAEGRLVGSYHVGQPLTLGGVHQPGTSLAYFPADEFCLYVIDITKRTCANILYTRHSAGSLRGLPRIASDGKGDWLLWCQAKGRDRTEITPLALPLAHHEPKPGEPIVALAGISAPPWLDAQRLAMMTDAGTLALWGVRQQGTRDPLLFPMLPSDFLVDAGKRSGRCQVVHADAENIWTLSRGRLQRVESAFHPTKGPELLAPWTQPVPLGSALHEVQVRREMGGRTILYLTTQAEDRATCLCSAVSADDGKILWQRQIGVLPQGPPKLSGGQIVLPSAEGILSFQPHSEKSASQWQKAGDWLVKEPGLKGSRILLMRDASFVQLSWPADATKLKVEIGQVHAAEKIRSFEVKLPAPLQGTPALGDGFALLPLANGIVVRMSLADGALVNGPDWRAVGAEEGSPGHVVMLSPTEFILTDGSRGVARIVSTDGKTWDRQGKQLAHRIVRLPVVVPATDASKARLCTLDASDTLTLLDADRLTVLKSWPMPGTVTAGPFVRAGKIGCVVGRNQLVWLDPDQEKAAWAYAFDADVVGAPHLIDGVLVVGDVAGQFSALDPASGRPLGAKLTLKANVAPTATPLPYGPGQAFVPLTDGTIIIVPLAKLR